MAHHKRKGPKKTRAGCLYCKPYKAQGNSRGGVKAKYRVVSDGAR